MRLKPLFILIRLCGATQSRALSKLNRGSNFFATRGSGLAMVVLVVLLLGPSPFAGAQNAKYPQTIVFMTDFGGVADSVAICRGGMYSIMPEGRLVDLPHQVPPLSILDGAGFFFGATPN